MTDLNKFKINIYSVRPNTIKKVVTYLEQELGLHIYGTHADTESAEAYPGYMDYDIENILKLRKFYMKGYEFEEKS